MKIAIISNLYHPVERGGAERFARKQAIEMAKTADVSILTSCAYKKGSTEGFNIQKGEGGEKIYRFFPLNVFSIVNIQRFAGWLWVPVRLIWHMLDLFNLHSYKMFLKFLKHEKPEIIYTHNMKGMGLAAAFAVKKYRDNNPGVFWLHHLHDVQLIVPSGLLYASGSGRKELFQIIFWRWYSFLTKIFFDSPDIVVSPTNWLWNLHKRLGFFPKSRLELLRGKNGDSFFNQNTAEAAEKSPKPKREKHTRSGFAYIGQLEEHKGVLILMKAWSKWVDKISEEMDKGEDPEKGLMPLPRLHIAGAGNMQKKIIEEAGKDGSVSYIGNLDAEDVKNLMHSVIAVIVPSIVHENAPNVIREAHENGAKIIASSVGGVNELVDEDDVLIEPSSTEDLFFAFDKLARGDLKF